MDNRNQWLTELGEDEDFWAEKETFEAIPSMITELYGQLRNLAQDGNVYGVMLQCKYLYETLYRVPVIMSLIVMDSELTNRDADDYRQIIKAAIGAPLSMGLWDKLAGEIIRSEGISIPDSIREILECTADLYDEEVSSRFPDVINWRNSEIGHGALRFEDDSYYREEIENLLEMLKDYFEGDVSTLYADAYFCMGGEKLTGSNYVHEIREESLVLYAGGQQYSISGYAYRNDIRYYLFDSYYVKKQIIKYSSFEDGQDMAVRSDYFKGLYERYVASGDGSFEYNGAYLSREQEQMLEYLNMPTDYIKPDYLIKSLESTMKETKRGVIGIFMERGTGKSAFANRMSGLYHSKSLIGSNSLCRCYHVQNAAIRGLSDFVNSVNFSFRHSFDHAKDLAGSSMVLPSLTMGSDDPAKELADFLNGYHRLYEKKYTLLLIDGIDELTEQTGCILDYIPTSDQLDEGVFVILLSRFKEEETVRGIGKRYIERAESLLENRILIKRDSPENIALMMKFISRQSKKDGGFDEEYADELIRKSDHRFLYLKAYVEMGRDVSLNSTNEYEFFGSYMDHITSLYGARQMKSVRKMAATIALFPSITIGRYHEYLDCMEITYEFLGQLNDLMPLLTVLRVDGEDVYEFADAAYVDYVLTEYTEEVKEVIRFFYATLGSRLHKYMLHGSFIRRLSIPREWMVSNDKLNEMLDFFIDGTVGISNRGRDRDYIRDLFYESAEPFILCAQAYSDSRQSTGDWVYRKMQFMECMVDAFRFYVVHGDNAAASKWFNGARGWMERENWEKINEESHEDGIFGDNSSTVTELLGAREFKELHRFVVLNRDRINPREWFWLISRNVSEEMLQVIVSSEELTNDFLHYCYGADYYEYIGSSYEWTRKLAGQELSEENRKLAEDMMRAMEKDIKNRNDSLSGETGEMDNYADEHRYTNELRELFEADRDAEDRYDRIEAFLLEKDTHRFFYFSASDRLMFKMDYESSVDGPRLYCSNNFLYLLELYHREGRVERLKALMERLEEDIRILDAHNEYSPFMNARCEMQKERFYKLRKDIGYSSDFDAYVEDIPRVHLDAVSTMVDTMSGDTSIYDLDYHMELLMEYAWQTADYEEGCRFCPELKAILGRKAQAPDPAVRKIVEDRIEGVENYSSFFRFLNGDDTAVPAETYMGNLFDAYMIEGVKVNYAVEKYFTDFDSISRQDLELNVSYRPGNLY